jgi:hypothetical protein
VEDKAAREKEREDSFGHIHWVEYGLPPRLCPPAGVTLDRVWVLPVGGAVSTPLYKWGA